LTTVLTTTDLVTPHLDVPQLPAIDAVADVRGQAGAAVKRRSYGLETLFAGSVIAAFGMGLSFPAVQQALGVNLASPSVQDSATPLRSSVDTGGLMVAAQAPTALSKDDGQIVQFLSKKYHLAPIEVEKYVQHAKQAAKQQNLDVSLILAVASIESNFISITESIAGAQGLMQVRTPVHLDKLAVYGGASKVFDPYSNFMVGAKILADCIKSTGTVETGLKCYVGATGPSDGGYGIKVLAEKERIEKARLGVFDFAPNNKVLQDLGLIAAASPVVSNQPPASGADYSNEVNAANAATAIITCRASGDAASRRCVGSAATQPPIRPCRQCSRSGDKTKITKKQGKQWH
jgi:soluble lytic murein transglycosylase-like protein